MKRLFLLTPCEFTKIGFQELTTSERFDDINILNCTDYRDILKKSDNNPQDSLIIIDITIRPYSLRVRQLTNLWNLRRLMFLGILRRIPVVVFGRKEKEENIESIQCIDSQTTPEIMIDTIIGIYKHPENYVTTQASLSYRKQILLCKFITGDGLQRLAKSMDTHPRNIHSQRKWLMKKLGLRNRFDFVFLALEDLL